MFSSVLIFLLASVMAGFVIWRYLLFFRNPDRKIPVNPDTILAPADGQIVYCRYVENNGRDPILSLKKRKILRLEDLMNVEHPGLVGKKGWLIGIYMSPFDVHFNRTPVAGTIRKISHEFPGHPGRGRNLSMFNVMSNLIYDNKPYHEDCDYLVTNERASYTIENNGFAMFVTQIADRWIRKIVTYKDQEHVEQGDVFGLIRMGSQVDIFVPDGHGFKVVVEERQPTTAGITVLMERATRKNQ